MLFFKCNRTDHRKTMKIMCIQSVQKFIRLETIPMKYFILVVK